MKETYGMYGGKFMPFHKGHLYCVEQALTYCDRLYLILCANGTQEDNILHEVAQRASCGGYDWMDLRPDKRWKTVKQVAEKFNGRVIPIYCDLKDCRFPDGTEDWDAETPIILNACKERFDYVFGSEPSYTDYFKRAYPWAQYIQIDANRSAVNISATKIRNMTTEAERKEWEVK